MRIILWLIATSLLALLLLDKKEEKESVVPKSPVTIPSPPQKSEIQKKKEEINGLAQQVAPVVVDTSSIAGRKLGGLYADIVGIEGTLGKAHSVNYGENLSILWHKKLDRKSVSPATIKAADEPIRVYVTEPKKMSLVQFVKEADAQVAVVKKHLDHQALCKAYSMDRAECEVFKKLAHDVRGIDLVAYGMTEIMPSAEGDLNVKVLEILLTNAGSNYMFTIPALYDRMLSLGFYQFTSYALNDVTKEGASSVNRFLPAGFKIPGSVIALRNGEHHRAAYLFALHNLARLAKVTTTKEFEVLKVALKRKPGDIVTYMATAHHAPGLALRNAKSWLASGAKAPINNYLKGRLKPYGNKSDNNLAALEKKLL